VFEAPAGQPPEWQNLLRLLAIVQGRGAQVDVLALDDELLQSEVQRHAGVDTAAVLQALAGKTGPERLLDLALRSGPHGDQFGRQPDGLTLDKVAATPGGVDLGPLQPRVPEVLRTASGCIELAPPELLADLPRAAADLHAVQPDLVVIGRRDVRSNNSWMHNLPLLAKGPFRGTALLHTKDAAARGLADGARARLATAQGSVDVQIEISDSVMPGVVSLPHGWGHDLPGAKLSVAAQRPGVNLNAILDMQARDPLSGNSVLGGVAVSLTAL
jgi:anaerobic selenocysteine-containing dehydrogenase